MSGKNSIKQFLLNGFRYFGENDPNPEVPEAFNNTKFLGSISRTDDQSGRNRVVGEGECEGES